MRTLSPSGPGNMWLDLSKPPFIRLAPGLWKPRLRRSSTVRLDRHFTCMTPLLPIEIEADRERRTARMSLPEVIEYTAEPIKNPAGEEHRAQICLPNGFEYREAEMGNTTWLKVTADRLPLNTVIATRSSIPSTGVTNAPKTRGGGRRGSCGTGVFGQLLCNHGVP
jgi:hypothetical protein